MGRIVRLGLPLGGIAIAMIMVVASKGLSLFLHLPSLLLTVGGTVLVTFLSFPRHQLRALGAAVREATAAGGLIDTEIDQVKALARRYRFAGAPGLEGLEREVDNPFLRRGLQLLQAWRLPQDLGATLEGEYVRMVAHYEDCRRILLTIGKLLPAFGLIGTLVSLVLLLRQPGELTTASIGPALSLALLTTLYGALLANAVVLPLEAKLQTFIDHQRVRFEIGLRATQLILEQAYPSVIEQKLACFQAAAPEWLSGGSERSGDDPEDIRLH